jgi:hypothetical protein
VDHAIDSIAQLEILLLLHRSAPEAWDAERLSAELRIGAAWITEQLRTLRERAFLVEIAPDSGVYRYAPGSLDLAKSVDALAAAYADRRVTVVGLIYSKPTHTIRVFAEAFRFRTEDSDG